MPADAGFQCDKAALMEGWGGVGADERDTDIIDIKVPLLRK